MSNYRQGPNIVGNVGQHTHRPLPTANGPTCQDCGQILVNPVLSQEDFDARVTGNLQDRASAEFAEALGAFRAEIRGPMPLDYLLMALTDAIDRGWIEHDWPPYVVMVGDRYAKEENFGGMPPHTQNTDVTDWWVAE